MGVPAGIPKGTRRPSHVAYYVALVGIVSLLLMLCLYFFYYFIKKVKELSSMDSLSLQTASCRPPPAAAAYPVQPVVRDSASAMAKLCKQVPTTGKGDTVFPTSTSPAALRTSTGDDDQRPDRPSEPGADWPTEAGLDRPSEPGSDGPIDPRPAKPPPAPVSVTLDVAAR